MEINKNNYEAFFLDYHEGNHTAEEAAALLLFVEQHPELKEEFESFENFTIEDLSSVEFTGKSILKKEITGFNKETYFIGYIENTLNEAEKKLFADFLSQRPTAAAELELYKKTVVTAEHSVVFENKYALKRAASVAAELTEQEYLLIAAAENILSADEKIAMEKLLSADAGIEKQLELYKQTRFIPDTALVFERKENLKRKSEKIVPLYYYIAAAASIILLVGIFFLYKINTPADVIEMAKNIQPKKQNTVAQTEAVVTTPVKVHEKNQVLKTNTVKKEKHTTVPAILTPDVINTIAKTEGFDTTQLNAPVKDELTVPNSETAVTDIAAGKASPSPVKITLPEPAAAVPQYASLRELATEKIKEKLLDDDIVAIQKKTGQTKKMNGWDIAQIVTKGISKVSGRQLELKPNYNENGSITSYAFSAGEFKISKKL